jgi:DNA-binding NarL/FixJ family response regulator
MTADTETTKSIRVLLVEDHEVSLSGLKASLSQEDGISIVGTAVNSDEGLELARDLQPDVVLLDLHLPGSLGPRSMVKSFCDLPHTKVIVFSVENRPAYVETILELGPAGYLLKSETMNRVAEAIRSVVSNNRKIISDELSPSSSKLTLTEHDLLKMLARGMKYQTIAERRHTSPETIRKQCETLMLKLQLENREELISWAARNGYAGLDL